MKTFWKSGVVFTFLVLIVIKCTCSQIEIILRPGPQDGKDAYVNTYYTTGNGSTQSFIASAWTYNGTEGIGRSFIQFDLPELPTEFTNFKALINFYYDYSSQHVGHGGENASKIERVIEDWSEYGIDWDNQPSVSNENAVYVPSSITDDQCYPNIDVTKIVADMYQNPEASFGFRLSLIEENVYRSMILASSDHPDEIIRPSLIIRYDTCMLPANYFGFETNFLNCQFYYEDPTVTNWKWDFGNGYGSELQNPSYFYTESGTYLVCLEIENSCGKEVICDSIIVCEEKFPDFTFLADGLHVDFFNTSIGNIGYFWDFGNGFFSHLENTEFQYESAGEYLVCLSAVDQCGSSTKCRTVQVNLNPFGIGDDVCLKEVNIYPNPAYSDFFITADNLTIDRIEICNMMGNVIKRINTETTSNNYHVFLQGYSRGIYLIKINYENRLLIKKLVLQ